MLTITVAKTLLQKVLGWMGRSNLSPCEGLLIPGCQQVHTAFVRVAIDVVWFDAVGQVVALTSALVPWRLSPRIPGAVCCLELVAGSIQRYQVELGEPAPFSAMYYVAHVIQNLCLKQNRGQPTNLAKPCPNTAYSSPLSLLG